MKRLHRYLPALPVWLVLLLLLWHFQTPPASNSNTSAEVVGSAKPAPALTKNAPLGRRTSAASAVSQDFSPRDLSDLDFPKRADLRWREIVAETVFEDFRRWTENLRVAGAGVDLQQGIKLAQQRRYELLALIDADDPLPRVRVAELLVELGRPDEAEALLGSLLTTTPPSLAMTVAEAALADIRSTRLN
jgi:hypothetical protein